MNEYDTSGALHCAAKCLLAVTMDLTLLFAFLKSEIKFWSPLACEAIVDVPTKITGVEESFLSAVTTEGMQWSVLEMRVSTVRAVSHAGSA
jgi:hypothetical protein